MAAADAADSAPPPNAADAVETAGAQRLIAPPTTAADAVGSSGTPPPAATDDAEAAAAPMLVVPPPPPPPPEQKIQSMRNGGEEPSPSEMDKIRLIDWFGTPVIGSIKVQLPSLVDDQKPYGMIGNIKLYVACRHTSFSINNRPSSSTNFSISEPDCGQKSHSVGAGLSNPQLWTCFLNCTLQCMVHTVPLVLKLREADHPDPCPRASIGFCCFCSLKLHANECIRLRGSAFYPDSFVNHLKSISSNFKIGLQQDAHEFLSHLLEKLDEASIAPRSSSTKEGGIAEEIFGGRLKSHLCCQQCYRCTETPEEFVVLSLEITMAESLMDALQSFTKVELMKHFICVGCKSNDVEKHLKLEQAPEVLVIHLKRFTNSGGKIWDKVKYPLELDINSFMSSSDDTLQKYDLYGVVVHLGECGMGHYVCYIRSSVDDWYEFNDDKVCRCSEASVLDGTAYLLFYVKQGSSPWFSTLLEKEDRFPLDDSVSLSERGTTTGSDVPIPIMDKQLGAHGEKAEAKRKKKLKTKKKVISQETKQGELCTTNGQKKLAKYNPTVVEKSWYAWWESSGHFRADYTSNRPAFFMVLPPASIAETHQLGHALTVVIQDTVIRWRRMSGYNASWIPGMDCAEALKDQYGATIVKQLCQLGASIDWHVEPFKKDESAATEAFASLYEKGIIYRDNQMVNWDFTLQTAASPMEVYLYPIIDAHGQNMLESVDVVPLKEMKEPYRSNVKLHVDPIDVVINGMSFERLVDMAKEGILDLSALNISEEALEPIGIPQCGTDALRFAHLSLTSKSYRTDINVKTVIYYRQWCSKLWNVIHTAMGMLGDNYTPPANLHVPFLPPICRWILSVLTKTIKRTVDSLGAYSFSIATEAVYLWWQQQMRNVFIEAIQPYFRNSDGFLMERVACRHTLWICLDAGLRLLHPFMPYITEELWQPLPHPKYSCRKNSIMISEYPSPVKEWIDNKLEDEMFIVLETVKKIKSLKLQAGKVERQTAFAICKGQGAADIIQRYQSVIGTLSSVADVKIVRENVEIPVNCTTAIVNEETSVYLRRQDVWLDKLMKKKAQLQSLHRGTYELEQQPNMSEPGHAPPLAPDQESEISRRFLAFLRGYEMDGHKYYNVLFKALASIGSAGMPIRYSHLLQFDPSLANTIYFFLGRVQKHLDHAAKIFLKEDVGFHVENPVVEISDRPTSRSFIPLEEFWNLDGHHPSEECDIYCGEKSMRITKSTLSGRVVLSNIIRKVFHNFQRGNSLGGRWSIKDVMVCLQTYEVEIIRPFLDKCNYKTLNKDILVIANDIMAKFKCGGLLPAFFDHLDDSMRSFQNDIDNLSPSAFRKFRIFVSTHFALKAPLTRSNFLDNLHEVWQTLTKNAKGILEKILRAEHEWISKVGGKGLQNPVLSVVYEHNKKKMQKVTLDRKRKNDKNMAIEDSGDEDDEDVWDVEDVQAVAAALAAEIVQLGDADHEDLNAETMQKLAEEVVKVLVSDVKKARILGGTKRKLPFETTLGGLLVFSRHIKQHGSKGAKNDSGDQQLQEISEIDLIMSHMLWMLPEILKALIYHIDDEKDKAKPEDYARFLVMLWETFQEYNTPEFVRNSDAEMETFLLFSDSENSTKE